VGGTALIRVRNIGPNRVAQCDGFGASDQRVGVPDPQRVDNEEAAKRWNRQVHENAYRLI
jgi:hypothetical protein